MTTHEHFKRVDERMHELQMRVYALISKTAAHELRNDVDRIDVALMHARDAIDALRFKVDRRDD